MLNWVHYLDNNATTRVRPEVLQAMLPFFDSSWGNPSSTYSFGHDLKPQIEHAREQIAGLIGADPPEIIFTACGTESINTAIHSAISTQPEKKHLVTTAVEHSATLNFCNWLQKKGYELTVLPISANGGLDLDRLRQAIRPDTALVCVMWANNETGLLFPIEQVGRICRDRGVLFHTDAVQMAGKLPIDVNKAECDFLSLSGHKLHAPKGIGALYVRRTTRFQPYLMGGGQERGRRGGTENVPYIIGFGQAAELAQKSIQEDGTRITALRDRLEKGLLESIQGCARNGPSAPRLPNTSNLAFEGVEAEGILLLLNEVDICASSGSACTAGSLDPSHVLLAMGCSSSRARSSIRFSLSRESTEADVDHVLRQLPSIVNRLRQLAPAGS